GKCVYCPTEVRMPKSYIETEPAAQRALKNNFDPYNQIISRLRALENNGHPTDKIELIVKGCTWSAYRWDYQLWFIRRCFDACNDFGSERTTESNAITRDHESGTFKFVDLPDMQTHDVISKFTNEELVRLEAAQVFNESSAHRVIGLTLETRPDWIRPHTMWQLRTLGCTRVELGLQHTDDDILALTKRGHTIEQTAEAMELLRHAGFKVDVHTMPQLPGSTPEKDYAMFEKIFNDEKLRPDMLKIYPCVVTPTAEIAEWYAAGSYTPYPTPDLVEMLVRVKSNLIPRYCRISRLIRDIPGDEIIAGNLVTNLRETIQHELGVRGLKCVCLRCREIGHASQHSPALLLQLGDATVFIDEYRASDGTEYFLSIEDAERRAVFAFARLYIPDANATEMVEKLHELLPETRNTAFIRELHTYGFLVPLTGDNTKDQQHKGLGKKLMLAAEEVARKHGRPTMTVISGIGVRGYYEKIGYRRVGTYMVKSLQ
ncbi:MAG: tRNA uridine(34) 5-carboxymethylaminomethyl modification radical SAM/GNAT enzyme Elp3, partial [Candidatus Magasanikbacteria bacterium]|nr:tRNA uridine(34) 5-carboxymethylaminomethyl modification radical SAM/GNAT enzyme Elp3 [Candidatus Magasanikbacteria bacterium]